MDAGRCTRLWQLASRLRVRRCNAGAHGHDDRFARQSGRRNPGNEGSNLRLCSRWLNPPRLDKRGFTLKRADLRLVNAGHMNVRTCIEHRLTSRTGLQTRNDLSDRIGPTYGLTLYNFLREHYAILPTPSPLTTHRCDRTHCSTQQQRGGFQAFLLCVLYGYSLPLAHRFIPPVTLSEPPSADPHAWSYE